MILITVIMMEDMRILVCRDIFKKFLLRYNTLQANILNILLMTILMSNGQLRATEKIPNNQTHLHYWDQIKPSVLNLF